MSGGTSVLVGQPKNNEDLVFENFVNNFIGKTLLDTSGGNINPDKDIQKYIDLYTKENIDLNNLIFDYYSLDEINMLLIRLRKVKIFWKRSILFD